MNEHRAKAKEHGISVLHLVRATGFTMQEIVKYFKDEEELPAAKKNKLEVELNKLAEKKSAATTIA